MTSLYKQVVLTTIDIKIIDGTKHVEFTSEDSNASNKAVFLKDISSTRTGRNTYKFYATYITPEEAKTEIHQDLEGKVQDPNNVNILFCIHGFNVQPFGCLENMRNRAMSRLEGMGFPYYPVPVLWPCSDVANNWTDTRWQAYYDDQLHPSMDAGKNLKILVDGIDNDLFPKKSLLAHSMGNHVLFNGACGQLDESGKDHFETPDIYFDNIFMVAADIPHDVFYRASRSGESNGRVDYPKGTREFKLFGLKYYKAVALKNMLKKGVDGKPLGKIYVLYNDSDRPLMGSASFFANWEDRLGRVGHKYEPGYVLEDMFGKYVESYNYEAELQDDDRGVFGYHSYQFEQNALNYYASKLLKSVKKKPTEIAGFYTIQSVLSKRFVKAEGDHWVGEEITHTDDGTDTKCQFYFKPHQSSNGKKNVTVNVNITNHQNTISMFFVNIGVNNNEVQMQSNHYTLRIRENNDGTFTISNMANQNNRMLSFYNDKVLQGDNFGTNEKWYIEPV